MKKNSIRIIALVLVAATFAIFMSSCSKSIGATVTVSLSDEYCAFKRAQDPSFTPPKQNVVMSTMVDIIVEDGEDMNGIRVLSEACAMRDLKMTAGATDPTSIGTYSEFRYDPSTDTPVEGYDTPLYFYWQMYVNGEKAASTSAATIINDGDNVEFKFTYIASKTTA